MAIVVRILLSVQIATGILWTLSFAMTEGRGDFSLLGQLFLVFGVQAFCFVAGLLLYWRFAALRGKAKWLLILPFVFWFLPYGIRFAAGGHLTERALVHALLFLALVALGFCLAMPGRVAGLIPRLLFRSRIFNSLILGATVLGWLVLAGTLVWVFGVEGESTARSLRRDATGYGLGAAIAIASLYLIALGGASVLSGTWAWLGLRSGIEGACRKLNIAQLVAAAPGILIGGGAMIFLSGNP